MKLMAFVLFSMTFSAYASDCKRAVEIKVKKQYEHSKENLIMKTKYLGLANTGHRFKNNVHVAKVGVYSVGTSDENGGELYVAAVDQWDCRLINLKKVAIDVD